MGFIIDLVENPIIQVDIVEDQVVTVETGKGVTVSKDGAKVGSTRWIDFVTGNNITLAVTKTDGKILVEITSTASGSSGSGDVTGPAASTDGELTVFDGATGKIIKAGGVVVSAFAKTILDDADATTAIQTLGAVKSTPLLVGATNNRYYGSGIVSALTTTNAIGADVLRAYPFILEKGQTFDRIIAEVTGGVGGSNFRIGIYNDTGLVFPGSLILQSGDLSGASAAVLSATINQALDPGLYWFSIVASANITMRAWANGTVPTVLGSLATMGTASNCQGYGGVFSFAALPANYPTIASGQTFAVNTQLAAQILLRASA